MPARAPPPPMLCANLQLVYVFVAVFPHLTGFCSFAAGCVPNLLRPACATAEELRRPRVVSFLPFHGWLVGGPCDSKGGDMIACSCPPFLVGLNRSTA